MSTVLEWFDRLKDSNEDFMHSTFMINDTIVDGEILLMTLKDLVKKFKSSKSITLSKHTGMPQHTWTSIPYVYIKKGKYPIAKNFKDIDPLNMVPIGDQHEDSSLPEMNNCYENIILLDRNGVRTAVNKSMFMNCLLNVKRKMKHPLYPYVVGDDELAIIISLPSVFEEVFSYLYGDNLDIKGFVDVVATKPIESSTKIIDIE